MNCIIWEVFEDFVGIEFSVIIVLVRFGFCYIGIFDILLFIWFFLWVLY